METTKISMGHNIGVIMHSKIHDMYLGPLGACLLFFRTWHWPKPSSMSLSVAKLLRYDSACGVTFIHSKPQTRSCVYANALGEGSSGSCLRVGSLLRV